MGLGRSRSSIRTTSPSRPSRSGFTSAIGSYLGFAHSIQTAIDDIQEVIKYAKFLVLGPAAFALAAMSALIDRLRELVKTQLEQVKNEMKRQLALALIDIIDAVTGRDVMQDKDRAIGDVLTEATEGLEDVEAHLARLTAAVARRSRRALARRA